MSPELSAYIQWLGVPLMLGLVAALYKARQIDLGKAERPRSRMSAWLDLLDTPGAAGGLLANVVVVALTTVIGGDITLRDLLGSWWSFMLAVAGGLTIMTTAMFALDLWPRRLLLAKSNDDLSKLTQIVVLLLLIFFASWVGALWQIHIPDLVPVK